MTRPTDEELEAMAVELECDHWLDAAAMLRACKGRVRVRPLEWVDLYRDGSRYEVSSGDPLGYTDSIHGLQDGTYHSHFGAFPTLEAAKTAAQADYERRVLAALKPAPDHGEWKPIETCPKTPTARLVWVPENQCIYCVAWKEDREYPWSGTWVIFGGGHRDAIKRATHWMPLPAPPALKKGQTND